MKKTMLFLSFFFCLTVVFAQDYTNQVENNNRFCFELFSDIPSVDKNIFLSPFSVSSALAMTYEGARGKTRKEMAEVLHFPEKGNELNEAFNIIIRDVQKSVNPEFYTLTIANSIWAQENYRFLHSFFTAVEKYYSAKIAEVNFEDKRKREAARLEINSWVSKKTHSKIKNLLDKTALNRDTKMVLVNAVYFLAKWDKVFDQKFTEGDVFYSLQGKLTKDFMHSKNRMKYTHKDHIELLEIPFKDKKASMIVLLPDTALNFNSFKNALTHKQFEKLYKNAKYRPVSLIFPKFKTEYKNDLSQILSAAGIKQAFSNSADFSGMTCKKELQIDKVIHQTFIHVDESGTEAAAATAVTMRKITSGNPADKIIFKADRPFIYLIKEHTTGSILFIGQLIN